MINKFDRIAGIIVLILFFLYTVIGTKAQNVVRKGNTFVEQKSDSARGGATKTNMLFTDSKGQTDTIYVSSKGSAFVWRVSKKTGKRYRRYLPKVTEQLKSSKK